MSKLKLQTRTELDTQKGQERLREIQEGKKLATRVDLLRKTVADEERSLEQFRLTTVEAIHKEIDAQVIEKARLVNEIVHLHEERAALLVPLDAKWAEVRATEAVVALGREEVAQASERLSADKIALEGAKLAVQLDFERVADDREHVNKLLADATRMNTDAATELMKARTESRTMTSNAQAIEAAALKKERGVNLMAGFVNQRRLQNEKEANRLTEERTRLRDAWATLERTQQRLK